MLLLLKHLTLCGDLAGSSDEDAVIAAAAAAATGTPLQQQQQQQHDEAASSTGQLDPHYHEQLHQGAMAGELKPTIATTNPALMGTNVLHEIDRAVQVSTAAAGASWNTWVGHGRRTVPSGAVLVNQGQVICSCRPTSCSTQMMGHRS